MSYTHFCVAKTFAGLEGVLEQELIRAGASKTRQLSRAVSFQATNESLYAICWRVRTALRILVQLRQFRAGKDNIYYHQIRKIDWNKYIGVDKTFVVDGVAANTQLFTHSQYLAQKTKDGIVDRIRNDQGERPSVDKHNPDIRVHVHIYQNQCQVFLDASGDILFKRGFERQGGEAPLNEVLAAGLLLISDWNGKEPLLDPMCGSGTFLREASAIARNISPYHENRQFGLEKWPYFDQPLWLEEKAKAFANPAPLPKLYGSDQDQDAIYLAKHNLGKADLLDHVALETSAFEKRKAPEPKGMIIMNPPYDERLTIEDGRAFYRMIGDHLKQSFQGWRAWIFSGNIEGIKAVGLRPYSKQTLYNGSIKSRFHAFELYEGSKDV